MPQPEANEVIIRVRAVAINPVDAAIQGMGIIIEDYPAVVGCDVAGDVTGVGAEVKAFLPGDRVIACLDLEVGRVNKGSFQLYCAAFTTLAAKLPVNVSYTQGCVLPLALSTAATSLFQKGNLEMQHPLIDAKPNGKGVLIWGGSSSVGSCAIQMAKAAGYEVATTCSRHNIEYCRSLGADHVFDHRKGNVVEDVVHALNGKEFAGAFDAVFPPDTIMKCAKIAHKLGGKKHVATVMVPSMPIPKGLPEGVMTSYCKPCRSTDSGDRDADIFAQAGAARSRTTK